MFQHEHKPQQKRPIPWDWHFHDTHLIDPSFSETEEKKLQARYWWHVFKDLFGKLKTMIQSQNDTELSQINETISKTEQIFNEFRNAMFNPLVDKYKHFSTSRLYTDVGRTVSELYKKRSFIYIVQDNIEYLLSFPWYKLDDSDEKHFIQKLFREIIFSIQAMAKHFNNRDFKDKSGLDFGDLEERCGPLITLRDTEEWSYYWTSLANGTLKYIHNHITAACASGHNGNNLRTFLFTPTERSLWKMKDLVAKIERYLQDDSLYRNYQFLSDLKLELKDYEGNRYDHPDNRILVSTEEQVSRLPVKRCRKCNSVWTYKKIDATGSVCYKVASPSAYTTPGVQQSFAPHFSQMSPAVQQLFASHSAYTTPAVRQSFAPLLPQMSPSVQQQFAHRLPQMSPSVQQLFASSSAYMTPYVRQSFDSSEASDDSQGSDTAINKEQHRPE